ncbi:trypsin-like serine protease [Kribbella sandramycini]|uniref:Streptogrisin C n=1 Tax=Kribbella sandramycini TaxID=60450 RepID=A0A7Y4P2D4_9ACTN|nr:alpha-lytic protease prodomain-containing protein [Kribbella sandramycini]MBB6570365.1 streptogrisin C [Kribbella sandramycini]NOL45227.1 trypsin-like serine protease [Kribbella sandramycini]
MSRRTAALAATLSAAGLVAAVLAVPPVAAAIRSGGPDVTAPTQDPPAEMLAALARDLKLTPAEARARLAREKEAAGVEATLRTRLGTGFAGAWFETGGTTLTVGVTDASNAALVRAAGASPKTVSRSLIQLDALKNRLDSRAGRAPKSVPGWYVDVATNTVTILTRPGAVEQAKAFATTSGLDASAVRFATSTEAPRPLIDVIGGNAYYIGSGTRCSIGFAVTGGFVTAGHCGQAGQTTTQPSGTVAGSSFPGNDYGWVRVAAGNTPRALVNRYPGTVPVAGATEAPVGSSVCRSGSTTGWRCGTILQKNASVTYPEGTITGLTRTNACAEPGDSGGSWITGDQAQGVTSGGSGNCTSGGVIYFQPLNEILGAYSLTLTVSGSTPPTTPPTTPPGGTTWQAGTTYAAGAVVTYGGQRYECWQSHTAQPGWEPPNVPALWRTL